ncbi:hypothetical protein Pcinc_034540 [Petrolisthes cinctipes]|uniref:Uncharacterized protein n=1 Tax=Petrolisthes cinctipes TaxID=88211 RepID=A0AAE1EQ31_PETCI|nr:hypothetical protein Pcinc_034540 [Petrolisthes cinctipes]
MRESGSITMLLFLLGMVAPSAANTHQQADQPASYGLVAAPVLLFLLVVYLEVTRRPPDLMELAPNMEAVDPL